MLAGTVSASLPLISSSQSSAHTYCQGLYMSTAQSVDRKSMTDKGLIDTVAYRGLICGICKNVEKGCVGCRGGGGADDCYHRRCCLEWGIDGCWQCDVSPCDRGFFADEAWKGLCRGFIRCIKRKGVEQFVSLVQSRLGNVVEYGEFRFKKEQDILTTLWSPGE